MRTLLLFAIAATVVMAGCGKGDDGTQSVQLINGSKHKQMLYADDTQSTISFHAADAWSVAIEGATRDEAEWLSLDKWQGEAGDCEIVITIDENPTGESRTARIIITCGENYITINVVQQPFKRDESDDKAVFPVGYKVLDKGYNSRGGGGVTWMKVRTTYSDGTHKDSNASSVICASSKREIIPYKILPNADIKLESYTLVKGERKRGGGMDKTSNVIVYTQEYIYRMQYNQFSADIYFTVEEAEYVDGNKVIPMPCPELKLKYVWDPQISYIHDDHAEDIGDFHSYYFKQTVICEFDNYDYWGTVSCQIIVKK